jgi:glycosyltransferase involved in cell wall biosynthesis
VYVADAGSVDGTANIALSFRPRLDVEVIPGGLPSVGRNAGARRAATPYVLFLDADVELADPTLLRRAVALMERKELHCLTTDIFCRQGGIRDKALYMGNNIAQRGSRLFKPFSTGMFMLFDRQVFWSLGGFAEDALYAEDYQLSKKVARSRFRVLSGGILTSNRRFAKMGHAQVVKLFLKTALNSWNEAYFARDQHYWAS